MIPLDEYGLGVCELLDASEGGSLPAAFVMRELDLSEDAYRELQQYLKQEEAIRDAIRLAELGPMGMQGGHGFYNWREQKKKEYLPLSFNSKRLARSLREAKPDLRRVPRPWEKLRWDYGQRYRDAAAELIQEELAYEDRQSDNEVQFYYLALTAHGAEAIRRDFRLEAIGRRPSEGAQREDGPRGEKPDFSFITNRDLRSIILRDYVEIRACLDAQAYKAATVMCGSVMEALLLDKLLEDEANAKQCAQNLQATIGKVHKDLSRWKLGQVIEVAVGLQIVPDRFARMTDALRDYRNLIHPAVEIRKKIRPGWQDANLARSALDLLIKTLAETS